MDFDFLSRSFLQSARTAIHDFRRAVEEAQPPGKELDDLLEGVRSFGHAPSLDETNSAFTIFAPPEQSFQG